jgi:hypothetical protein
MRSPESNSPEDDFASSLVTMAEPNGSQSNGGQSFRQQVENSISQISQVIHAALRPLPEQTGDGSYLPDSNTQTGMWSDLGHVGIKDVGTLIEVVKTGGMGALVNDKDMLMERIIQVGFASSRGA